MLKEALKIANPDWRPLIPEWDHISQQILGIGLADVITGKKAPKEALDGDGCRRPRTSCARRGWLKG